MLRSARFSSSSQTLSLRVKPEKEALVLCCWTDPAAFKVGFCQSFMAEEQEQAIGELEAFAVLEALVLWMDLIKSRHLVSDNEGARFLILRAVEST